MSNLQLRVGVDVVGVPRMERLVGENAGIVDTLFTASERDYCLGKRRWAEHMAGRFAAKEAVLKALGTGIGQRMRWTDVEIVHAGGGRPRVRLRGEVASWASRRDLAGLDVSLAHSGGVAVAHALATWEGEDGAPPSWERDRALPSD